MFKVQSEDWILELDSQIGKAQFTNETQDGLLTALSDILQKLTEPCSSSNSLDEDAKRLIIYGLLRNYKAIRALLRCLTDSVQEQGKQLAAIQQFYSSEL